MISIIYDIIVVVSLQFNILLNAIIIY